ncbi:MAG TPA: hypothetical protein VFX35_07860 [Solirubrobacterales bacterium]|nr:hypothetical protein [Solirubrobacterales bacterium]
MAMAVGMALALSSSIASCGGSGEEHAVEAPPRLTKAQLGERMGDVCQEHTDRQVVAIESFDKKHSWPYGTDHEKATDKQLEEELVKVILPIVRDNIHDLEELRPSRRQEADFAAFLRALEHGIAYSERDPSWVVTGATEPFSKARELAWKLGTAYCGQA